MWPSSTRNAPYPNPAAAPTAIAVSVIPRDRELVASTHIVLLKSLIERFFSKSIRDSL